MKKYRTILKLAQASYRALKIPCLLFPKSSFHEGYHWQLALRGKTNNAATPFRLKNL